MGPNRQGLGKVGPRITHRPGPRGRGTTGLEAKRDVRPRALPRGQREKDEPERDGGRLAEALATGLQQDGHLAVSQRRVGHMATNRAEPGRLGVSRRQVEVSRPSLPGKSRSTRNGHLTKGRLHLGQKLRVGLLLGRLMRLDRRSGPACTLSQFTIQRGQELTAPAQAGHRPAGHTLAKEGRDVRNSGGQGRLGREQPDPARLVHFAARAGFRDHPPPAAASRAPVDHGRAASRESLAGDRSVPGPVAAGLERVETRGLVETRGAGKARRSFVPVARTPARSARPVRAGSPSQALAARANRAQAIARVPNPEAF